MGSTICRLGTPPAGLPVGGDSMLARRMRPMSTVPLVPFLRRLLDVQIEQEQKDATDLQRAKNRLPTLWEVAVPRVLAELRFPGVTTTDIRYHLARVNFDGIHWPRQEGKTGAAFRDSTTRCRQQDHHCRH
jgi:hypothetical protein